VRSIEDLSVVKLAAQSGVTFDVCPISNVRLNVVKSIAVHPLRSLLKAGVRCTISTDDPLCFANTLIDEYSALYNEGGFSFEELASLAIAGWEVADVSVSTRNSSIATIRKLLESQIKTH
jgi:hypothetical protein